MKRIQFSAIVMVLILLLAACGTSGDNDNENANNDGVNNNEVEEEQNDNNNDNVSADNNADDTTNNESATNDEDNATNNSEEKTGTQERMEEFSFTTLILNVEYDDETAYQLDLTYRNDFVNVHLQDDLGDTHARGRDAFNEIYPSLQELDLDPDTDEDDAISEILEAFDLNDDYTTFELEMEFDDGTLEVTE